MGRSTARRIKGGTASACRSKAPSPDSDFSSTWYRTAVSTKRRAYIAWAMVCVLWGTTYLGIRISLETIPPFLMAAIRWLVAGTVLAVVLKLRGEHLSRPPAWPSLLILGTLLLGFGNGGVVWAEQTVPSGLAAVLVATCPFWMVGIDVLMPGGQRLTFRRVAGFIVGFGGILLLAWPEIRLGC